MHSMLAQLGYTHLWNTVRLQLSRPFFCPGPVFSISQPSTAPTPLKVPSLTASKPSTCILSATHTQSAVNHPPRSPHCGSLGLRHDYTALPTRGRKASPILLRSHPSASASTPPSASSRPFTRVDFDRHNKIQNIVRRQAKAIRFVVEQNHVDLCRAVFRRLIAPFDQHMAVQLLDNIECLRRSRPRRRPVAHGR